MMPPGPEWLKAHGLHADQAGRSQQERQRIADIAGVGELHRRLHATCEPNRCRVCGCGGPSSCRTFGVPCIWIDDNLPGRLCSACATVEQLAADRVGRTWIVAVICGAGNEDRRPFEKQRATAFAT